MTYDDWKTTDVAGDEAEAEQRRLEREREALDEAEHRERVALAMKLLSACETLTLYPGLSCFVLPEPCDGIPRGHWLLSMDHESGENKYASGQDLTSALIAAAAVASEREKP